MRATRRARTRRVASNKVLEVPGTDDRPRIPAIIPLWPIRPCIPEYNLSESGSGWPTVTAGQQATGSRVGIAGNNSDGAHAGEKWSTYSRGGTNEDRSLFKY